MVEEQDELNEEAGGSPKSRKKLFAIGGVVGGLAVAFLAALMAVPKKRVDPVFDGPFVAPLTSEKIQVNLNDAKGFLILNLNITYDAYKEKYFKARSEDLLAQAEIKDALVALASSKTREDVSDPVNKPVLMEEIRSAVDPLIFPVHVGAGKNGAPTNPDKSSGLVSGLSSHLGTFRGEYEQHVLHVDAAEKTVRLDGGPIVSFTGGEADLEVPTGDDLLLYLDVTGLKGGFAGDVKVGVMGRVRRVLWNEVLIQ